MNVKLLLALLAFTSVACAAADDAAGSALARRLRTSVPTEDSEIRGVLQISPSKGTRTDVPVLCQVKVHDGTWETIYQTTAANQMGAERLIITHSATGPNQYLDARAANFSAPLPEPKPVSPGDISRPFAASDFSLSDLAMEFLHWPGQRQLKGEMRLGQPCDVLESTRPGAAGIVRVKSYIDKDSGGLLVAEAYDRQGREVKEFSLHGSSFKKVNGHWRLEKMDIRNEQTDSHTVLKFDLPKD